MRLIRQHVARLCVGVQWCCSNVSGIHEAKCWIMRQNDGYVDANTQSSPAKLAHSRDHQNHVGIWRITRSTNTQLLKTRQAVVQDKARLLFRSLFFLFLPFFLFSFIYWTIAMEAIWWQFAFIHCWELWKDKWKDESKRIMGIQNEVQIRLNIRLKVMVVWCLVPLYSLQESSLVGLSMKSRLSCLNHETW